MIIWAPLDLFPMTAPPPRRPRAPPRRRTAPCWGACVAYYGWYAVRIQRDSTIQDPVIDAAGTAQRGISGILEAAGLAVIAVVFAALLIAGLTVHRWRQAHRSRETDAA
ncbi:hypothetical protein ABZ729_33200 [Streptomyces sp. NPDC006678]|uniref:hypothetical protein n=1 Tax=Streptomyces sp. NPDC006678 TaxID=3157185 RepID=UPI0033FE5EE5